MRIVPSPDVQEQVPPGGMWVRCVRRSMRSHPIAATKLSRRGVVDIADRTARGSGAHLLAPRAEDAIAESFFSNLTRGLPNRSSRPPWSSLTRALVDYIDG